MSSQATATRGGSSRWDDLGSRVLEGQPATREEALAVLRSSDDELLDVVQAAFRARKKHFGRKVNLQVLRNAKSGLCSENCAFCSQSVLAESGVDRYPMQPADSIVEGARDAAKLGAIRYCIVTSARAPSPKDLETILEAVRRIRAEMNISLCTSLGFLTDGMAARLVEAGVNRYNHNLETSERHFPRICTSHKWEDRVRTVRTAKAAGLEVCCGGIIGLGETLEDRADWALALRDLDVDAIPVNFFNPRPGTPLQDTPTPAPAEGLRALAMMRLVNPARELRAAGGREACLRHMQPLALYMVNSIFTNGYLTTPGQGHAADVAMIRDAGFEIGALEA